MFLECLVEQIGQRRILVGIDFVFNVGGVAVEPNLVHVLLLGIQALSPF